MTRILGCCLFASLGALWMLGCPVSPADSPPATGNPAVAPAGNGPKANSPAVEDPGAASPGIQLDENGAPIIDESKLPAPGEGIVVSGTATYDGKQEGSIRVDLIQTDGSGEGGLQPLNTVLAGPDGTWKFEVPKDMATVSMVAYIDVNGDGPNPGEPSGVQSGVAVAPEGVRGIEIVLSESDDAFRSLGKPEGAPDAQDPGKPPLPEGAPPVPDGEVTPAGAPPSAKDAPPPPPSQ